MSKLSDYVGDLLGDIVAEILGWAVCLGVLIGCYSLGHVVAPHIGWPDGRDTLGLLSALAALWLYEHQNIERKYDRLRDLIAGQRSSIPN